MLGLLFGMGATGWYLYPSVTTIGLAGGPVPAEPAALRAMRGQPAEGLAAVPEVLPAAVPISPGVHAIRAQRKPLAPLAIETPPGPLHYYIKLEDATTGELTMAMFIDGGRAFRTKVPLGSYRILYATGKTWYGTWHLFGPETRQFELDRTFDFSRTAGAYAGVKIELGRRVRGNLASIAISPAEFRSPEDAPELPASL